MNIKTKILAAFVVATIGGTILGMLLSSNGDDKPRRTDKSQRENESFLHRLFQGKKGKALEESIKQHAEEYEQA